MTSYLDYSNNQWKDLCKVFEQSKSNGPDGALKRFDLEKNAPNLDSVYALDCQCQNKLGKWEHENRDH